MAKSVSKKAPPSSYLSSARGFVSECSRAGSTLKTFAEMMSSKWSEGWLRFQAITWLPDPIVSTLYRRIFDPGRSYRCEVSMFSVVPGARQVLP